MDVPELATAIAALLAPFLAKGAEKFVEEFGKDAYAKSKALLARVRRRFRGKPQAERALAECQRAPGPESQQALAEAIQGELVASPRLAHNWAPLAQELAALLERARPAGPKYQVAAKVVGAVGDDARVTLRLDKDALND